MTLTQLAVAAAIYQLPTTKDTNKMQLTRSAPPIICDVSHHQGIIDWPTVAHAGMKGVFLKATEGTTFIDPMFTRNSTGATNAGIVTGPYHFARPARHTAKEEADFFLSVIGVPSKATLPAVLDIESVKHMGSMTKAQSVAWVKTFTGLVKAAGWPVWTYSYVPFMAQFGLGKSSDAPVQWVARYSATPPRVPWVLWQYSSSARVPGVRGLCDVNRLRPGAVFESIVTRHA